MDSGEVLKRVKILRAVIPFFPKDEEAGSVIAMSIEGMVDTVEKLDWLIHLAINVMAKWSLADLRGLYCSRYRPSDGVYGPCSIAGYTPTDTIAREEQEYIEAQTEERSRELAQWKEQKRLNPSEYESFPTHPIQQLAQQKRLT